MKAKWLRMTTLMGVLLIGVLATSGCPSQGLAAPSGLTKTNEFPCVIEWNDNSNNEQGFNIYIGHPCTDCEAVTSWTLAASVGANVTSYSWTESCCDVAECSCAMVRAYNANGESSNSNVIMLAPVC